MPTRPSLRPIRNRFSNGLLRDLFYLAGGGDDDLERPAREALRAWRRGEGLFARAKDKT
jgi:hypothetical protein